MRAVYRPQEEPTDERDCLACDILAGRQESPGGAIYENDYWAVEHSVSPVLLAGFLIVKPKRHCEQIADLTLDEMEAFGQVLHDTTNALTRVLRPEKVYVCSFGEMGKHIHFYVIPRTSDMPASGREVLRLMFEGRWACSDEEAEEVAVRVKAEMEKVASRPTE